MVVAVPAILSVEVTDVVSGSVQVPGSTPIIAMMVGLGMTGLTNVLIERRPVGERPLPFPACIEDHTVRIDTLVHVSPDGIDVLPFGEHGIMAVDTLGGIVVFARTADGTRMGAAGAVALGTLLARNIRRKLGIPLGVCQMAELTVGNEEIGVVRRRYGQTLGTKGEGKSVSVPVTLGAVLPVKVPDIIALRIEIGRSHPTSPVMIRAGVAHLTDVLIVGRPIREGAGAGGRNELDKALQGLTGHVIEVGEEALDILSVGCAESVVLFLGMRVVASDA